MVGNQDYVPERARRGVHEKGHGEGLGGDGHEEVLHPANVAMASNNLASVAEGVGSTGELLFRRRQGEKFDGFFFKLRNELHGDAVFGDLEETEVLACSDEKGLGAWLRKADGGDAGEEGALLHRRRGRQDHHGRAEQNRGDRRKQRRSFGRFDMCSYLSIL